MKVNLWGINYAPELTGIGVYSTGLAEYLSQQGDQVTVVTGFPYYPHWSLEKNLPLYRTEDISGVEVCRSALFVPSKPTPFLRILHEASFVFTSFFRQLTLPAADIYVVVSPPLLLGFAAWLICLIKNRPFVFHVQDLQPDAAAGLLMLKQGLFLKVLYWLEKFAYEKAKIVSAISRQMCSLIEGKGIAKEKIFLFPNWVHNNSSETKSSWKSKMGIAANHSLVSYAGNMGVKQGLPVILQAAKLLKDKPVTFVIAGNGVEFSSLSKLKDDNELNNVILLDVLPEEEHTHFLQDSDICLIPQKKGAVTAFLPSKLLKMLALGRPVVAITQEEGALSAALAEGGFGVRVEPDDEKALAEALLNLLADESKRRQMSEKARMYVKQFSDEVVLDKVRRKLLELVGEKT
jgi:colanic acid biosynthesis glycosyl transferase WcaI